MFKGDLVSPDVRARLIKIVEQIEADDAAKHATLPYLSFDKTNLLFSSSVSPKIQGVVAGWLKLLGLKSNFYVTTIADARADKDKFTGPHRAIGSAALDANENGSIRRLSNGDYVLAFREGMSIGRTLEVIAHEIGHAHMREAYDRADAKTKQAIDAAYNEWLASTKKYVG